MFKLANLYCLLFLATISLNACSDTTHGNNFSNPIPTTLATEQPITTFTPIITPIPTSPTISPTTVVNPILPQTTLQTQCPIIYHQNQSLWSSSGTILFSRGRIFNKEWPHIIDPQLGIWGISVRNKQPYLVYESASSIAISPNGTILLDTRINSQTNKQETILYNLVNKEESIFESYNNDSFMKLWLNEDKPYRVINAYIKGVGIQQTTFILNSNTGVVEKINQEIQLPDFAFDDSEQDRGIFKGYASLDPTGQFILYTASKRDNNEFEIRLLNINTGEVVWQHNIPYLIDKGLNVFDKSPHWAEDGSSVLFLLYDTNQNWREIIGLKPDGSTETFPTQPFPYIEAGQLNGFSRSPNGQYLFYTAWEMDPKTWISTTRAFIVDLITGNIHEICDPLTTFISPVPTHGEEAGFWLPNNQFVYRVLIEKEGLLSHSLRVLDIPTWSTQVLIETEPGEGVNVFGWTPVEFP
jgi:hypothetical protein